MAPPSFHGPQDTGLDTPTQEAFVEKYDIRTMKQDALVPKANFSEPAPRTHSNHDRASSS